LSVRAAIKDSVWAAGLGHVLIAPIFVTCCGLLESFDGSFIRFYNEIICGGFHEFQKP